MIWALTLKPGQECTYEGLELIHLSLASLECRPGKCQAGTGGSDPISYLLLKSGHTEQVLCTLEKGHSTQQNLDLVLQPRERVTFSVEGSGVVYVTGYSSSLPVDESEEEEEEEEGIMGRIEDEELNPLHTVVKQEPEDDFYWEQSYNDGESGQLDGDTMYGEEDAVLIKVEQEEEPPEDEDARNVEIQGEISEVDNEINESDTAGGDIASGTRNGVPAIQAAGDTSDVPMKVTDTQQNEEITENDLSRSGIASRTRNAVQTTIAEGDTSDVSLKVTETGENENNTENDHTPSGNSNVARNVEGSVIESTSSKKSKLGAQVSERHPRPTDTRVLPTRRGVVSSHTRNAFRRRLAENCDENLMQTSDLHETVDTEAIDKTTNNCSDTINDQGENVNRRRLRSTVKRDLPPPSRGCSSHVTNDQEGSALDMTAHKALTSHRSEVRSRNIGPKIKRNLRCRRDTRPALTLTSVGRGCTNGNLNKTFVNKLDDGRVCQRCGERFSSEYHRMEHQKLHVHKNSYKCRFCDQTFSITSKRNVHESVHMKGKFFRCQFCDRPFKTKKSLGQHENTHTGHRPYRCSICCKVFASKPNLIRHRKLHTGTRYECKICSKSYTSKRYLKAHSNIHTGDRRYKCKYCDKTFVCRYNVCYHEFTHGKDSKFKCQKCGKAFFNKGGLHRHQNAHAGQAPCAAFVEKVIH